jgi:membrane fusion protein (multidrug efflux system)
MGFTKLVRSPAHVIAALAALALPAAAQQGGTGSGGTEGPTAVGVITLEPAQVPYSVTVPGRAVAFEQVDIRPRVAGVISEILYDPGRPVSVGDPLFRIDGDTYAADLKAAEASVAGARAALAAAEATLTRYQQLENRSVTVEDVDSARVKAAEAEATLSAAEAARDLARLNLERTEILSPISGVPDVATVSVGAIVTANQSEALTTVTRLDPIYVDIEESSRRIQETRDRFEAGTLTPGREAGFALTLETGKTYDRKGALVAPGVSVSTTTGTTALRLKFDNPDHAILPGQFLRVKMTLGATTALLVPQRATSRGSDGSLTAFVAVAGKAEQRTLVESGSYQNAWIVVEGVRAGEALIVDGRTNLAEGAEVSTVPVTISPEGVVEDAAEAKADAPAPAPAPAPRSN